MISHELKFVYIHIPKTGGSSLSIFLKDHVANKVTQQSNALGKGASIDVYCEILREKHAKLFPNRPPTEGELDGPFYSTKIVRGGESSKPPLPGRPIKHEPVQYYNNLYGEKINNYCKFAVVRNPYDLMMSLYFYDNLAKYFERGNDFITEGNDFRRERFDRPHFINYITADVHSFTSIPSDLQFRQYKYVINRDGEVDCNIIYFENMLEELKQLECLKSLDFENFPRINIADKNFGKQGNSNPLKYREFYDNELSELVYNKFEDDFHLFNYKKELD